MFIRYPQMSSDEHLKFVHGLMKHPVVLNLFWVVWRLYAPEIELHPGTKFSDFLFQMLNFLCCFLWGWWGGWRGVCVGKGRGCVVEEKGEGRRLC